MLFELRESDVATIRNRHEIGISWNFKLLRDEDGEPTTNEWELPEGIANWSRMTDVYAQGPTEGDWAWVGGIEYTQMEEATTFEELDIAAERIVRAEMARSGFEMGETVCTVNDDFGDEVRKTVIAVIL